MRKTPTGPRTLARRALAAPGAPPPEKAGAKKHGRKKHGPIGVDAPTGNPIPPRASDPPP